jgi:hypothetical protein
MLKVGLNLTPPDAPVSRTGRCPCVWSHRAKRTDGRHASLFKQASLIFNGHGKSFSRC